MSVFVHDGTVIDIMDSLGMVAVTDTGDTGYFHCDVCENDTVGSEYLLPAGLLHNQGSDWLTLTGGIGGYKLFIHVDIE